MDGGDERSAGILHADLDAFYASVEQRDDPHLRGRPVAVGGGVILAASYEAKRLGVRTAMNGRQARSLCPGLVIVQPRFEAYSAASKAVFDVFRDTTPLVQGISIDEAFLDVRGLRLIDSSPVDIAARVRSRIRADVGLPITVGVARTPFLAKVASRVAKPDGLLLVDPRAEEAFLHPLPLEVLWGVGEVTAAKLHSYGLTTAGDVAELPLQLLISALGPGMGRHLYAVVHGHTPARVETGRRRGSVGAQRALGSKHRGEPELRAILLGLVDRVSQRMRAGHRLAGTVVLRLRFADYTRATRSHTLPQPTSSGADVAAAALALLSKAGPLIAERGLTLIGVALTGLTSADHVQPTLDLDGDEDADLDAALDTIADRFGKRALIRGTLLRQGPGLEMPTLPDPPPS